MAKEVNFFRKMDTAKIKEKENRILDAIQKIENFLYILEKNQKTYTNAVNYLWDLQNRINEINSKKTISPSMQEERKNLQKELALLRQKLKSSGSIIVEKIEELKKFCSDYPKAISQVSIPPMIELSLNRNPSLKK